MTGILIVSQTPGEPSSSVSWTWCLSVVVWTTPPSRMSRGTGASRHRQRDHVDPQWHGIRRKCRVRFDLEIRENANARWGPGEWQQHDWANAVPASAGLAEFDPIGARRTQAITALVWLVALGGLRVGREEIRMGRAAVVIVVGVLGMLAFAQASPVAVGPPSFGTVPDDVGTATGDPSAWYCPWVAAGALRDSAFNLASVVDVGAAITLRVPIQPRTRMAGRSSFAVPELAAWMREPSFEGALRRVWWNSTTAPRLQRRRCGPKSSSPATGVWCRSPRSGTLWVGSPLRRFELELQLFNPFAESAKVRVEAITEFGSSPLAGFENIDIPGRSWVTEICLA